MNSLNGADINTTCSAVQILYEIIQSYHEQRVTVILVNGHPHAMKLIYRAGIIELIGHHFYFKDVTAAIKSIEEDLTYTSFPTSHRIGGNFPVD